MKHNLILCCICSSFAMFVTACSILKGESLFTPFTIFLVAAAYFVGRYMDEMNRTMTPEELESEIRRLLKDAKPFKPEWSPKRIAKFNLMVNELYYENLRSKREAENLLKPYEPHGRQNGSHGYR